MTSMELSLTRMTSRCFDRIEHARIAHDIQTAVEEFTQACAVLGPVINATLVLFHFLSIHNASRMVGLNSSYARSSDTG